MVHAPREARVSAGSLPGEQRVCHSGCPTGTGLGRQMGRGTPPSRGRDLCVRCMACCECGAGYRHNKPETGESKQI